MQLSWRWSVETMGRKVRGCEILKLKMLKMREKRYNIHIVTLQQSFWFLFYPHCVIVFGFLLVTTPSTVLNLSKFWYFSPESSCSVLTLQLYSFGCPCLFNKSSTLAASFSRQLEQEDEKRRAKAKAKAAGGLWCCPVSVCCTRKTKRPGTDRKKRCQFSCGGQGCSASEGSYIGTAIRADHSASFRSHHSWSWFRKTARSDKAGE